MALHELVNVNPIFMF